MYRLQVQASQMYEPRAGAVTLDDYVFTFELTHDGGNYVDSLTESVQVYDYEAGSTTTLVTTEKTGEDDDDDDEPYPGIQYGGPRWWMEPLSAL